MLPNVILRGGRQRDGLAVVGDSQGRFGSLVVHDVALLLRGGINEPRREVGAGVGTLPQTSAGNGRQSVLSSAEEFEVHDVRLEVMSILG